MKEKLMVVGGTGSFGSCLFKRLYGDPNSPELVVFSRDEKKQWDMARKYPNAKYVVGDIRDYERLCEALEGIDYVFHAAAYKHVPACENNPGEAIKTNIFGAMNIIRATMAQGVKRVVGLSTDKAVHPVNTMGMTKALQEKLFCSYDACSKKTRFINVRYGNILGSRGSVLPLFVDQVKAGTACILTDPKMTRFLLTLEDAVSLVLNALSCERTGVTLVSKMDSSTIEDLGLAVQQCFGTLTGFKVVGIRPGEKIHESLISYDELPFTYDCGGYFILDYNNPNPNPTLTAPYTSETGKRLSVVELKELLNKSKLLNGCLCDI